MKFITSAQIITAAILAFTTQVRSWEITFYNGGSDCGQTATNHVNYEGTDSDCHVIGSADDGCTGFTDGGATSDNGLCGAAFEPSSCQINPDNDPPASGTCTVFADMDCNTGDTLANVGLGCTELGTGWQSFQC